MTKRSPLVSPEPESWAWTGERSPIPRLDTARITASSITANKLHVTPAHPVRVVINSDGHAELIQDGPLENFTFEEPEPDDDPTATPSFLDRLNPFRKKKS